MENDLQLPLRAPLSKHDMRNQVNNCCAFPIVTGRGLHACREAARHGDKEMIGKCLTWLRQHAKPNEVTTLVLNELTNG
jgi:malic enzyme